MWFMDATESRKVTLHLKKFTVPDAEVSFALNEEIISCMGGGMHWEGLSSVVSVTSCEKGVVNERGAGCGR